MKVVYTVILLFFLTNSFGTIRIVKHNGTGQFSSIQSAITASVHGDTILVYPATYYENINYNGKNITIASLEFTTSNPAYRDSTIIDGHNNGSCVRVMLNETNAEIFGFTLQHGSGTPYLSYGATLTRGGAFRIKNVVNFRIFNCIITNNKASEGGGIHLTNGTINMKETKVFNNYSTSTGGGIVLSNNSNCIFDSNQRCSIYENYAGSMNDIVVADAGHVINVILDTFTVNPPTKYYANYVFSSQLNACNITYDILRAYREEINQDLYVSPNGNDDNDGLTPGNPLKTITKALHTIASDSLNVKTIYLATGTYSSTDGQMFPLGLKAHIRLIGDSLNVPIIVNQHYQQTCNSGFADGMTIKNLIIEHGTYQPVSVFLIINTLSSILSNITINPVHAITYAGINIIKSKCDLNNIVLNGLTSFCLSGINFDDSSYGSIKNSSINDCQENGDEDLPVYSLLTANLDSTLVLENVSITNCSVTSPTVSILSISHNLPSNHPINPTVRMTNVLVANNTSGGESPVFISLNSINTSTFTNCNFVNNSGGSNVVKISGRINVSNCIIDNGGFNEVNIRNTQIAGYTSNINFYNNMIRGYPNSVYINPSNQVTFNEFNFSAEPGFMGTDWTDPLSYRLDSNSPCIDAGTPDTTGLYLPLTDLYGNPRIYNGIIDIGCYEWDGVPNQDENIPIPDINTLSIYPNPFVDNTTLSYNLEKASDVRLEVYNTKGQRVKRLVNSKQSKGEQVIQWDGSDETGRTCTTGIYLIKYTRNNSRINTMKISHIR